MPRMAAAVTTAPTHSATCWLSGSDDHQPRMKAHAATTRPLSPAAHHLLAAVAPASMSATLSGGPENADDRPRALLSSSSVGRSLSPRSSAIDGSAMSSPATASDGTRTSLAVMRDTPFERKPQWSERSPMMMESADARKPRVGYAS